VAGGRGSTQVTSNVVSSLANPVIRPPLCVRLRNLCVALPQGLHATLAKLAQAYDAPTRFQLRWVVTRVFTSSWMLLLNERSHVHCVASLFSDCVFLQAVRAQRARLRGPPRAHQGGAVRREEQHARGETAMRGVC
jgi:hypothetical protein